MSSWGCEDVRERIPDYATNGLEEAAWRGFEEHVSACSSCRAELELARALRASRPTAPEGLGARVSQAVREDRRSAPRPWWGLAAAAVAALALGIGVVPTERDAGGIDVPGFAYEVGEEGLWLSDDGLLAGAPSLEALTDDALLQLLEDLQPGDRQGGAV